MLPLDTVWLDPETKVGEERGGEREKGREREGVAAAHAVTPHASALSCSPSVSRARPPAAQQNSHTHTPHDTVPRLPSQVPILTRGRALEAALAALASAGVAGVMVDVWWGVVEGGGPGLYEWDAYADLFARAADAGLAVQAVLSFHAAGGNVGDTCTVPLPPWVLAAGDAHPDLFYADRAGRRSQECLSLGADELPLLPGPARWGSGLGGGAGAGALGGVVGGGLFGRRTPTPPLRTPVQAYADFAASFAARFRPLLGSVIAEVTVGLGPAGELRYPSYPEGDGRWRFPGIGEFQCYDAHMASSLRRAAAAAGEPSWGTGPADAGSYTDPPWFSPFFYDGAGGGWDSPYGRFFLGWYSGELIAHADRVLGAVRAAVAAVAPVANAVVVAGGTTPSQASPQQTLPGSAGAAPPPPAALILPGGGFSGAAPRGGGAAAWAASPSASPSTSTPPAVHLGAKLAGVHWWFRTRAHAAELTAGYYNTRHRDGYGPIMATLARLGVRASFTCVEMRDAEHPPECEASPEGLLNQVLTAAAGAGVPLAGENALQRYDGSAMERIAISSLGRSAAAGRLAQLTFLRMGDLMFDNWPAFTDLLERLGAGPWEE